MHRGIGIVAFLVGTTLLAAEPAKIPLSEDIDPVLLGRWLEKAFDGKQPPEAARMLISIAKGSQMGPGDGWFGPCQSRYNWAWLAKQQGIKETDGIPKDKFKGPAALFARLDRNKNGEIGSDDLDWSDASPYLQQSAMINRVFRRLNKAGDGQLTREEWLKFFEEASKGKEALSPADLRDALLAGMSGGNRMAPGDAPTPQQLVRGLFRGEIGSMNEGPRVNEPAPDFSLKTRDGKETIRLSDQLGKKPIVLVFGNFTCGPFRSIYPQVDALAQRYKDDATFLCVYVREAHPTDGWRMAQNDMVGVAVGQPKTYKERVELAQRCSTKLKMSMPLLVDEIDDPVGNAYSGMPARLYVIDPSGKVAYKSGRGPFGFKPGEMEQALLMLLLDQGAK